ncbi:hypothetical protein D3C80_2047210 [compost metagenome]
MTQTRRRFPESFKREAVDQVQWVRNTPTTLTPLDSGRLLFGGSVPVKKPDPGEAADPLVVARFVTPFRNVI